MNNVENILGDEILETTEQILEDIDNCCGCNNAKKVLQDYSI